MSKKFFLKSIYIRFNISMNFWIVYITKKEKAIDFSIAFQGYISLYTYEAPAYFAGLKFHLIFLLIKAYFRALSHKHLNFSLRLL